MTRKRIEISIGFVLIAFSILVLSVASQFPGGQHTDVGAKFFPSMYAYILIGLSIIHIINSLFKVQKENTKEMAKSEWKKAVIGMVCTFLYFVIMNFFGFFISTVIFLAAMMWIFHYRKPLYIVLFSVGITALVYLGMSILLKVPLPSGTLLMM